MKKIVVNRRIYKVSEVDYKEIVRLLSHPVKAMGDMNIYHMLKNKAFEPVNSIIVLDYHEFKADDQPKISKRPRCVVCGCLLPSDAIVIRGEQYCHTHARMTFSRAEIIDAGYSPDSMKPSKPEPCERCGKAYGFGQLRNVDGQQMCPHCVAKFTEDALGNMLS